MNEPKVDPATLTLRAPPRPVTRLNRRTLTVVIAVLAAAVLGATLWSLQSRRGLNRAAPPELHNVERVARAEGLEQLPPDYSKVRPPVATTPVPVLGPPLPGDLGGPILRAERQAAANGDGSTFPSAPTVDSVEDAKRVERLNRQREADEAAKAPIFFRASNRRNEVASERGGSTTSASTTAAIDTTARGVDAASATNASGSTGVQDRKESFVKRAGEAATRSSNTLQVPISPYQLMAGTVIAAALITGINSDLPGQIIASVTEPVYDTASGRHLLIPQGSRLLGQYDSQVAFGQRRVLLVWTRLVLPDASSLVLERLPGVDSTGYAGLEDGVDWHWRQLLVGAALSTLIGVGAELAAPDRKTDASQIIIAARGSAQDTINQAGQELTRRNLNVQPTLTIRPGFPVRVIVNRDLVLRPYQPLFFERTRQ